MTTKNDKKPRHHGNNIHACNNDGINVEMRDPQGGEKEIGVDGRERPPAQRALSVCRVSSYIYNY